VIENVKIEWEHEDHTHVEDNEEDHSHDYDDSASDRDVQEHSEEITRAI